MATSIQGSAAPAAADAMLPAAGIVAGMMAGGGPGDARLAGRLGSTSQSSLSLVRSPGGGHNRWPPRSEAASWGRSLTPAAPAHPDMTASGNRRTSKGS
jgi:hypothetical protein